MQLPPSFQCKVQSNECKATSEFDTRGSGCYLLFPLCAGGSYNGSTADSGSVYRGSNPCPPAILPIPQPSAATGERRLQPALLSVGFSPRIILSRNSLAILRERTARLADGAKGERAGSKAPRL